MAFQKSRLTSRWGEESARLAVIAVVVCGVCVGLTTCGSAEPAAMPTASVDHPQLLTENQAEELAGMRLRNHIRGIVAIDGRLTGEAGDMLVRGWVDFANRVGYIRITPSGSLSFLVAWDEVSVAYLDVYDDAVEPPQSAPGIGWRSARFDAGASDLTRLLAALLLLSDDRPENPLLIGQNGARFLGEEKVGAITARRFSGVSTEPGGGADLGTQYWLDEESTLVRFGIRLAGSEMSTVDFSAPDADLSGLPRASDLAGADGG